MPRLPPERAFYLLCEPDPAFAVLQPAAGAPSGTGVVICPPFGWDEVASYRSRRHWAEHLARRGHTALRLDLPGTGDSAGSPRDPGRLAAWDAAVAAAVAHLRAEAGGRRVALVGLGLGGLLALRAVEATVPVDDVVLWAVPPHGRAFVRELRAFARLEAAKNGLPETSGDGELESGGFLVTTETLDALAAYAEPGRGADGLRRALLLDRDGRPAAPAIRDRLAASARVETAPGPGYEDMVAHPQTSRPPLEVFARVARWLEAGATEAATAPARPAVAADSVTLRVGDATIRETPVRIDGSFGVLAEPVAGAAAAVTGVLLNAGAVRRIGPNRLWVETARAWAARGVPTLRLDLPRIGDGGTDAGLTDTADFYDRSLLRRVREALDWLAQRGPSRFAVAGLCSGGHWAFHVAAADHRVRAAVLVNTTALVWDPGVIAEDWPPGPRSVLDPRRLRGDWSRQRARELGGSLGRWFVVTLGRWAAIRRRRRTIERTLDRLAAAGTFITLAYASDQPEQLGLERSSARRRLGQRPNVTLVEVPGSDHSVRPLPAQRAVRQLLDGMLTAELRREGAG